MNTRLIILGIFLSSGLSLHSQYIRHYLTAGVGTGIFSFNYDIEGGKSKPKLGFAGKVSYCFYFSPNWGIGGGFDMSMYSTNGYLDGAKVSFDNKIDDEDDVYRKDVYFRDWSEMQTAIYAEFPIELHYQYDFGLRKRRMMYLHFGAKVQLPLMGQYKVTHGKLETQRYYPEWDIVLSNMPNHGFGTDGSRKISGKMTLPLNIAATVGFNFLFEMTKKIDIFAGGAFDYGFISTKSVNNGDLLYEDESANLQYRGITASSAIDKMNTIATRGEIGIRCALGKEYRPKLSLRRR
jgi:hypothetical protein